ncbi:MAG: hypothetical protein JNM71_16075 [Flavobacterium lindanitolerans]|uniref:hypothetical protein n=1 Tax=Flavobacterium lindanitolerans TaxID=428988 RepID=UPI001A47CEFF|nr:hypothetical protein [Flavobacterium lindanitolerans]MBL7869533.1 hypothetical protein [Flavobacterium lindanitolerans]
MKTLYLLTLVLFSTFVHSQEYQRYKVVNIDSTISSYVITVKSCNKKNIIKKALVLTSKTDTVFKNVRKIKVGSTFKLKLEEIFTDVTSNLNSTSLIIDNILVWKRDDDFRIYSSDNIKGLNYFKI